LVNIKNHYIDSKNTLFFGLVKRKLLNAGNEAMADRYTYLPSIGIFTMFSRSISVMQCKTF